MIILFCDDSLTPKDTKETTSWRLKMGPSRGRTGPGRTDGALSGRSPAASPRPLSRGPRRVGNPKSRLRSVPHTFGGWTDPTALLLLLSTTKSLR